MIKRLIIKDCLGIEELTINAGKVNVISGGNERGKTSILETIEKALFNTKRRAKFVRTGAEKAYIELETDDGILVKRTVKEDAAGLDSGSAKITKDGKPISKTPESFLKELFGVTARKGRDVFAFNPVDFMQKKENEQTDILLGLMDITVTAEDALRWFGEAPKINYEKHGLQVLKALEEWFYEMRREVNSRVSAVADEVAAVEKRLPDNYQLGEWKDISLADIYTELHEAEKTNQQIMDAMKLRDNTPGAVEAVMNKYALEEKTARESRDAQLKIITESFDDRKEEVANRIAVIDKEINELLRRKDQLQTELNIMSISQEADGLEKELAAKVEAIKKARTKELQGLDQKAEEAKTLLEVLQPIELTPIKSRAETVEKMKAFIPLASELQGLRNRLKAEEHQAEIYDNRVEQARAKPQELLAKVELPVKDLGIDKKGNVTIKGLPVSNLSTARQVQVCLDIARALAKNNPLKLICVDKLEHLDATVRAEFLKQIEADQEFQFFVTVVTDGDLKVEAR